jgi:hypothetical protein
MTLSMTAFSKQEGVEEVKRALSALDTKGKVYHPTPLYPSMKY